MAALMRYSEAKQLFRKDSLIVVFFLLFPKQKFLSCLKQKDHNHHECRDYSRDYLDCRMKRGLMKEENLDEMGFSSDAIVHTSVSDSEIKEAEGFVAGKHIQRRRKWFWERNE